jgi:hypothetical protein
MFTVSEEINVQVAQERQPDSRGSSPARGRQTPPKLTEANGEEVPKATLEEAARVAASHGKLRFCVMALLAARNFRVRRKLGQDVINLFKESRSDKVLQHIVPRSCALSSDMNM